MKSERRFSAAALLCALAASALFGSLGAWQLSRAAFKQQLLAGYERAAMQAPAPLAPAVDAGNLDQANAKLRSGAASEEMQLWRKQMPLRVVGSGVFDSAATVLLDNQISGGQAGAMVLSLFRPRGGDRAVLVNRGWIALPADRRLPALPAAPPDEVEVSGLLTPAPAAGIKLGNAHFARGTPPPLLNYVDTRAIARDMQAPLFEGVLLLDPQQAFGFQRQWQALPNTIAPERHRAYALQWFALALTSLIVFGVLTWRKGRT